MLEQPVTVEEPIKDSTADRKFDAYKLAFEHADKEWNMLWQRNNAFLVANSAFVLMLGLLKSQIIFGLIVSIVGLLLALIWLHSNREAYAWNMYWIRELRDLENGLAGCKLWTKTASKRAKDKGRPSSRFGFHGTYISLVFVAAWTVIVIFFLLASWGVIPSISVP